MKYDIDIIRQIVKENPGVPIIYFWGHTPDPGKMTAACFSQWYDCGFVVDGVSYHTAEQYMMAAKARLFKDEAVFQEIMSADDPAAYKKLGRKIHGFDQALWDACKYDIVVAGNKAKFGQNPILKEFLLSTGDAIIAEASPYDKIWGIGLHIAQALKGTVDDWKGENLLGCALMEVRDWLKE